MKYRVKKYAGTNVIILKIEAGPIMNQRYLSLYKLSQKSPIKGMIEYSIIICQIQLLLIIITFLIHWYCNILWDLIACKNTICRIFHFELDIFNFHQGLKVSNCLLSRYKQLWHYRLWSFKTRDTKLERFLHKNQHTQRKLLNFEDWTNGAPQ